MKRNVLSPFSTGRCPTIVIYTAVVKTKKLVGILRAFAFRHVADRTDTLRRKNHGRRGCCEFRASTYNTIKWEKNVKSWLEVKPWWEGKYRFSFLHSSRPLSDCSETAHARAGGQASGDQSVKTKEANVIQYVLHHKPLFVRTHSMINSLYHFLPFFFMCSYSIPMKLEINSYTHTCSCMEKVKILPIFS